MRYLTVLIALLIPLSAHCWGPFDGVCVSGVLGWDFAHFKEKSGAFSSENGNGFYGGVSIGWGHTWCGLLHLGGRVGYRSYTGDQADFAPAGSVVKEHGFFGDLLLGAQFCSHWLGYAIVGGRGDRFELIGDDSWDWGPRFGVGLQRALWCGLSVGVEYICDFNKLEVSSRGSSRIPRPTGFDVDSHQLALLLNLRL